LNNHGKTASYVDGFNMIKAADVDCSGIHGKLGNREWGMGNGEWELLFRKHNVFFSRFDC
jgi:hypothetical protein